MIARRAFLFSALAAPMLAAESELRWLPLPSPELEIDGLPWFGQNGGEFFRLPAASQEKFPPAVWNLAKSPSGALGIVATDESVFGPIRAIPRLLRVLRSQVESRMVRFQAAESLEMLREEEKQ